MRSNSLNKVMHSAGPSAYAGDYQVTEKALKDYQVTREKFGTTDVVLPDGSIFNVKDYQYVLENGEVGMHFIPINEYGLVNGPDGKEYWASQLADVFIRSKMGIGSEDPLYAFMYFIHPEQNCYTIPEMLKTPPDGPDKIEMGITHLGAYFGQGVTSNSPPLYHRRRWGVEHDPTEEGSFGYPCNVVVISMDGVDQAMLNKNLLIVDQFLNYGIRFPMDYKNSQFRMVDLNTSLMFYRDWINEENYLKTDASWFTYCAAHKTLVATIALNLPHNRQSFMEVYGAKEGSEFYDEFCKSHYTIFGQEFTEDLETYFEPLWMKEGLTPDQIKPFTKEEYYGYDKARRKGTLADFKGFRPLEPTLGTGWGPQVSADLIFDFVDAYVNFLYSGGSLSCATIVGFRNEITERMGITLAEYLRVSIPILAKIMQADAMIHARAQSTNDPISNFQQSKYYIDSFGSLFIGYGGKKEGIPAALKNLDGYEKKFRGKVKAAVNFLLKHNELLPEVLAWWSLDDVRENWSAIISSPGVQPTDAYEWMKKEIKSMFDDARKIVAPEKDKIEFNIQPSILHMIGVGMFPKNPHVNLKTICTIMTHTELEPKGS